jgi:alpha-tubulin N-acetyltransferase 1
MREGINVIREGAIDPETAEAINRLGYESAKAQKLKDPVTSIRRLGGDAVYVLVKDGKPQGFIKVGRRRLFLIRPDGGGLLPYNPLCVLDFFVRDKRKGYGQRLIEAMLESERADMRSLAFDRPSPKLISFLKSKFGITKLSFQANKFAIILPDFHLFNS